MKVYIAGPISGTKDYMERFQAAEDTLKAQGHTVLNPTAVSHFGLQHGEYMRIAFTLVDISDAVYFLKGWRDSAGATAEMWYAQALGKAVIKE